VDEFERFRLKYWSISHLGHHNDNDNNDNADARSKNVWRFRAPWSRDGTIFGLIERWKKHV
jgi:hypothetical protein